jgi:hypothetical protein
MYNVSMYNVLCINVSMYNVLCFMYWIVGCSTSGVRHAIATEKWLEAEHMKSLSAREKQRHMHEKAAADKMRSNSLSRGINGCDGDRENGGARQGDNDYELSGIDGRHGSSNGPSSSSSSGGSSSSSSGFNYDPMGDIPYEVEEEDDTDDDESEELIHVPSLTELAAEVAVLSNPYKDRYNFNPVNDVDQEQKVSLQKEVDISDSGKKKGKKIVSDSATGLSNSSPMASSSSFSSKPAAKRAPPKLKHQVDSEHNTKAGLRAEHGDYTGLLVNGLFTSSVLRTGSYYKSKDINIIKVI